MTHSQQFAAARAQTYELLSRLFAGDVDLLIQLRENQLRLEALMDPFGVDPAPLLNDAERQALERSYESLFAVPGPTYVPPFASAHHGSAPETAPETPSAFGETGGRLRSSPATTVQSIYDRIGFTPTRGDGRPDHIATELACLSAIAGSTDETVRTASTELLEHLQWTEQFATAVSEQDTLGVYTTVTAFTTALITQDRGW